MAVVETARVAEEAVVAIPPDDETAAILAVDDVAVRNGQITQRYHELAVDLAGRFDGEATWAAFGTWASLGAGRAIRGESFRDRGGRIDRGTEGHVARGSANRRFKLLSFLGAKRFEEGLFDDFVHELSERMAVPVAEGNALVFAELAPVLTALADGRVVTPAAGRDASRLDAAVVAWNAALSTNDPVQRAQLVCLGNLEAVAHEQWRLDTHIDEALAAPAGQVGEELRRFAAGTSPWPIRWFARWFLARPVRRMRTTLDAVVGRLMTEFVMEMELGDGFELDLGDDLPPLPGRPFVPPALVPPRPLALDAFLQRFDRSDGEGGGTAARDWADFDDRMNTITNLFVSRHSAPGLLRPPFTPAQVAELRAGRLPPDMP